MNIDDMTIGQIKEIQKILNLTQASVINNNTKTLNSMIGKKVIIRTFSAGVWFGKLIEKADNEVILENARRMYRWWANESITLSAVSLYGVKYDKSKIVEAVPQIWLQAIEILPCSLDAITSLEEAKNVKAE